MDIKELLQKTRELGASDLHLTSGYPPMARVDGDMLPISDELLSASKAEKIIIGTLDERLRKVFADDFEVDYAYDIENIGRFRVNAFMQNAGMSAVFRLINPEIPSFSDILAPEALQAISDLQHGLVIIAGPTGSGKSTTLAAMINHINQNYKKHIITIEDPIEYVYPHGKSLVNQRQLDLHTKSFSNALRAGLREDPDVILVGEMRDADTIRLALTAADTGHIVFSTLHTSSASASIARIIDAFDGDEKNIIRSILADSLQAVVSQKLIKKADDKGRVAAYEVLISNPAVKNLIKEDKVGQLVTVMQTSAQDGMQTFEKALENLKNEGLVN